MADRDITVQEVGPRDGLQATDIIMPTQAKVAWLEALANSGMPQVQVGSFVPPKLMPQLADTAELVAAARARGGFEITVLVPNLKGAERAIAAGVDQINFVMSVSEPHNLNNVRKTREESLDEFGAIVALRNATPGARGVKVSGGLATCFGCTIQGAVPEADVFHYAGRLKALGADKIGLADTVGYGNPTQVKRIYTEVLDIAGGTPVGAHFHDTRGLGLANCFAAFEAGASTLDGAQGGLGGCPYAPGATGNVVTEDLVFMLESMGVRTGINLDRLLAARAVMAAHLGDEPTHGTFVKAGPPKGFVPATAA
ncbi:hydroxymethylglutaryl-CoA lyase [Ruegeria sp. HKCCD4884]|uniref:hydroxymethylglutaryl-CoA lyase n=1 Tax=Ruegeria sp. HKCCD4884 TaxID=2683022 RepID=UPI001492D54A|nr:hydroxymethylglutaryl-CoA lyase [Ruegeria sp. HKCCD4884]NOD95291.1 hydroxymethylglutaryl-CoA lyase [Ruegeria sp. HKCCD4884]